MAPTDPAVAQAVAAFDESTVETTQPLSGGYIHGTWLVELASGRRLVAQRINRNVFADIDACEHTIDRVVRHVLASDDDRVRVPNHLRTTTGCLHHVGPDDAAWRVTEFVEHTHTRQIFANAATAREAAEMFGRYDRILAGLPGGPLIPTIEHFHDLPFRRRQLDEAIDRDSLRRAISCGAEIAQFRYAVTRLMDDIRELGPLPVRPTHGDAKVANLRFDDVSGRPAVVLDLDTTMNAPLLVDLGELLRTGGANATDEATDGVAVELDAERVVAIVQGFLDGLGSAVSTVERRSFRLAGPRMALFNGMRFLADHLSGDTYYAITQPDQNLDRAGTQLALAVELTAHADVVAAAAS
jgi:N-acetylhexosamine 1-kinase